MQYPYSEPGPIKELLDTADELELFSLDELDISSLEELELFSLEELTSTFDEEELLLASSLEELEFFLELEDVSTSTDQRPSSQAYIFFSAFTKATMPPRLAVQFGRSSSESTTSASSSEVEDELFFSSDFLLEEDAFADEEDFFDDDDSPPLLMLDFASDSETEDSASESSIFAVLISDSPLHEKRKAVKPTKVTVLFKDIRPHFGKDLFF